MPPPIAAVAFAFGILWLFLSDGDREIRTSWALWLPVMWLLIAGSRPVSVWLGTGTLSSAQQYMEGNPVNRNIYLVLVIASLMVVLLRAPAVVRVLRANWLILLFILYCGISIIWSDYPGVAFKRWFKSLGDFAMVLIVLTDQDQANAMKRVFARAGFVLLPLSLLLIKYYPYLGRAYATHEGTQFFVGVAEDKNMLGMTCLVFGLAACWRVFEELSGQRRRKILFVHGTVMAMAVWLLFLSDSMTSLACLVLASGLVAATSFSKFARKRMVIHLMVAAVVSVSFATLFLNVGGDVLSTMGRNPTLTGRTYIWDALLTIPTNPILGTGFESFWLGERLKILWSVPILEGINEAHNGYLELYLNLGWIGLILFAGIMIAGYRNVLRLLDKDPEAGRLRLGFFVIAVIYDFTEAAIRTSDLVWIGFLFAVFTLPKIAHEEEPEVTAKTVTPALVAERGRLRTLNPGRSRQTTIHSLGT